MRGGSVLKRFGLVVFGLSVGLLLTEAALQVAARVAQGTVAAELQHSWLTGNLKMVTLGDSHTYGLYFPPEVAYPKQLEALWAQEIKTPNLEVMNLGIPGTNSSNIVRILPGLIETLSPDIVLVMVGTNDFWTSPFEEVDESESLGRLIERHSKLYKLFHLVRHGGKSPEAELNLDPKPTLHSGASNTIRVGDREFEVKWSPASEDERGGKMLAPNYARLAEIARESGVELILLTYPSRIGFPKSASRIMRAVASVSNVKVIDVAKAFEERCDDEPCNNLLVKNDGHPKPEGHELIARTLLEALPPILTQLDSTAEESSP